MNDRPVLLDVSRLVWRGWRGAPPTGIDRVALAYLAHYRGRARAVVRRGSLGRTLGAAASDAAFALLGEPGGGSRAAIAARLLGDVPRRSDPVPPGTIYLNVGHTGLDHPGLARWAARTRVRPVYMIHDLIPLTHPQYCAAAAPPRHAERVARAVATGAGIVVNSAATGSTLHDWAARHGLSLPPVLVAWLGTEPLPPPGPPPFPGPYFVTLGTIEGRKNHLLLFELWRTLAERLGPLTPRLVVIGRPGWEASQALALLDRTPELRRHVVAVPDCGDAALASWLAHARALLFPSFAEGYGMPLAEALSLGTPVVASNLAVFRELAGDIPRYRDPLDGIGWRDAVLDLAEDGPSWLAAKAAARRFRAPTWAEHFARLDGWLSALPGAGRAAG